MKAKDSALKAKDLAYQAFRFGMDIRNRYTENDAKELFESWWQFDIERSVIAIIGKNYHDCVQWRLAYQKKHGRALEPKGGAWVDKDNIYLMGHDPCNLRGWNINQAHMLYGADQNPNFHTILKILKASIGRDQSNKLI